MANLIQQAKRFHAAYVSWLGEGGKPSPSADQRAAICLKCPHNKPDNWEVVVGGVASLARLQLELKSKMGLQAWGEERLHTCELCGCYLRLKVHVPLEIARTNTPDWHQFPDFCWIRKDDLT